MTADPLSRSAGFDVTVVIVNHNGGRYLNRCLNALAAQTTPPRQVLLVDNASTDGSAEHAERIVPGLQIIRCAENLGFAAANNLAVARSEPSEWLALLNPDAFPRPDWLATLRQATRDYPQYAVLGSRLLDAAHPERLDGAGDGYHVSGLAWRRGHGAEAAGQGMQVEEIFAPCAAAALYQRRAFCEADGFDERFFCYMEDVDLGFRLRLLGHRCLYVPTAVVHHVGSGITGVRSAFATYHGHRNQVWTYVKNMPSPWFWLYLPAHLALNLLSIAWLGTRGQGRIAVRAKIDAVRELPRVWRQRQAIQRQRRVGYRELRPVMTRTGAALARFIRPLNFPWRAGWAGPARSASSDQPAALAAPQVTTVPVAALPTRISVIIPTKNAGPEFAEILRQIRGQRGIAPLELIIIDSGSTDETLMLARQAGARLIEIPAADFEHAGTRNQAAHRATGDLLVFVVQDATPVAEDWLYRLVEPLVADRVDAVSVRAVPRADADLHARWSAWSFDRYLGFTHDSLRCGLDYADLTRLEPTTRRQLAHLDNVCLAISRPLFTQFQFRGHYAEDLDLGLRLLQTGYRLLYQVDNVIVHSHSRPASYFLRREYVNSRTLADLLGLTQGSHTLAEVLPSVRWGYHTFCLLSNARLMAVQRPANLPATLRALAGELRDLFTAPAASSLPWLDAPLLALLTPNDGTAPEPILLAQLGHQLHWSLNNLADYLDLPNSTTPAETVATLHQFYAVAAGALLAHTGVAPTSELVRGI